MRTLKEIICLCLVLVVWVGSALAEGKKEVVAPVIEIEEPTHDFNQVTQGEVVRHVFKVFNRGNAPLQIKNVKPG